MSSPRRGFLFFIGCMALAAVAGATYAGDRPLVTAFSGDGPLQYQFTTGDSSYLGGLGSNENYTASFSLELPAGAEVRFQRLYVYWAWSNLNQRPLFPAFHVTDSRDPLSALESDARYVDSKGVVGTYDFYSGTDAYAIPALLPGANTCTVTLVQRGPPGSSVLLYGMAILVVYEEPGQPRHAIWVKEGCDLLFSSFGISPEMASSAMIFEGKLPSDAIEGATLFLVAPSGGHSRDRDFEINSLRVNWVDEEQTPLMMRTIFSLLFPNYRGKEWFDIFLPDSRTQIGFETREIKPFLKRENNHVVVRDQGDYLQLTNAVLAIRTAGGSP
ncbi:MAG TPA: DUF3344 domain-containing protein [Methanoregulaceae archaeon]|jgi:hypothetical protein|nr:DUF3344 domain-containing protein [Methanoregulaceae archaeon]